MKIFLITMLVLLGGMAMAETKQTIRALTDSDKARLAKQRATIEQYLSEASKPKYETSAGKLGLLRALLDGGVFKTNQTYQLQCMGIVLGDVFVKETGMQWVMVSDEHGEDPAVQLPGTSIIIFPLTMISQRVERGEKVDIFALFNGLAARIDELKSKLKPAAPAT